MIGRIVFILVATLSAAAASAQQVVALHADGDAAAEYLGITDAYPPAADGEADRLVTRVARRMAVAPLDAWDLVARYPRRLRAMALLPDGRVAVLLDDGRDDADAQLRVVAAPDAQEARLREGPTETFPPSPPAGTRWIDVAAGAASLLADLPPTTRPATRPSTRPATRAAASHALLALDQNGALWSLDADGRAWSHRLDPPIDAASFDLVATGDGLALVAGRALYALDGQTWTLVASDLDPPALPVAGAASAVALSGGRLTTDDGDAVAFADLWQPPDGVTLANADPAAAATAAGAVRVTRAATTADGEGILLRAIPGGESVVVAVGAGRNVQLDGGLRLLLYGALVVAFVAMLLQGRRPSGPPALAAEPESKAAPVLAAPMHLRLAAAGVDLLPLVLTAGLLTSEPSIGDAAATAVVLVVGLVVYVGLPLAGEMLGGRSPGKALFGLRVIAADADESAEPRPASSAALIVRNVVRPLDLCGGWAAMLLNPARRRLGDLAAGTRVIYDPVRTPITVDPAD